MLFRLLRRDSFSVRRRFFALRKGFMVSGFLNAAAFIMYAVAILSVSCNNAAAGGGASTVGITSFHLTELNIDGVVDKDLGHVTFTVPHDTDLRAVTPEIKFEGTRVEPESGVKQNLHVPTKYMVYGSDGTTITYFVLAQFTNNPAEITAFSVTDDQSKVHTGVPSFDGGVKGVLSLTIPQGTNVSALKATVTIPQGYELKTSKTVTRESTESNTYTIEADDFTQEVVYTVTNGTYTRTYSVKITFALPDEKIIWYFEIPKQLTSVVDQTAGSINVRMSGAVLENGAKTEAQVLKALKPSISFSGGWIDPPNKAEQDFSNGPVVYKVYPSSTASDNTPKEYRVTVTIALPGEDNLTEGRLDLTSLVIAGVGNNIPLTLNFNKNQKDYVVATKANPTAAEKLYVTATPVSNTAKLTYVEAQKGLLAAHPFESYVFPRKKESTVTVRVENTVNGVTQSQDYVINLYRGSNNANLATWGAAPVNDVKYQWALYPEFNAATKDYILLSRRLDWANRLQLKPSVEDADASIAVTVNNKKTTVTPQNAISVFDQLIVPMDNTKDYLEATQDMKVKDLPPENKMTIEITSEDREVTKSYNLSRYAWINPAHQEGKIPAAGGGVITYVGNDEIHTFSTKELWTEIKDELHFPFAEFKPVNARVLLLGGGGAGGDGYWHGVLKNANGGGGGAGQVFQNDNFALSATTYQVVVGRGGKQMNYFNEKTDGENGGASIFGNMKAAGGGGGGKAGKQRSGYKWDQGGKITNGVPEGGNGNNNGGASTEGGGGGAGAGGVGSNSGNYKTGKGGAGIKSDISGANVEYGKGGDTISEDDGQAGMGNWGGGNGGNAERYSPEDKKGIYTTQSNLGVSANHGSGYGIQNKFEVHIQGGNGIVIVRFTRVK